MQVLSHTEIREVTGGLDYTGPLCAYHIMTPEEESLLGLDNWNGVAFYGLALARTNPAGQCELLFYPISAEKPIIFTGFPS